MKTLGRACLVLLLIFTLLGVNNIFAADNIPLTQARSALSKINKGNEYISRIDSVVSKYEDNKAILLKLDTRIAKLKESFINKEINTDLEAIVNYLAINVSLALESLLREEEKALEELKEDDKDDEVKKIEYPGFLSNYNDTAKNILAGSTAEVFAGGVSATIEEIDVEEMVVTFSGSNLLNFKSSVDYAILEVEGLEVARANNSDVKVLSSSRATIEFDSISNFIIPKKHIDFRIKLATKNIGFEKIGSTITDIQVIDTQFTKAIGMISDKNVGVNYNGEIGELFSIVPAIIETSVIHNLNDSTNVEINVKTDFGKNTKSINNSDPVSLLTQLSLVPLINPAGTIYTINNIDDSSDKVTGSLINNTIVFDLSLLDITNRSISSGKGENFRINITNTIQGVSLSLPKTSIIYDVGGVNGATMININKSSEENLGYRDF